MVSLGATAALVVAVLLLSRPREPDVLLAEAVNDHLRVLYSTHPLDVEGGGVHRVKPWFEGKVDFAPVVAFGGDDDFPLTGGAVAYFIDRKAAAYIYERRLHVITLLVYRAEGLPWSGVPTVQLGHVRAALRTTHGFNVLLWRDGDLGYSLVSDLNQQELVTLGAKIAGG
jgi:anti-sigma factor RsiW